MNKDTLENWVAKGVNFYTVLGVSHKSSEPEIKTAYRKLCLKHHPDKAGKEYDADKFNQIQAAYEALGAQKWRKMYDSLVIGTYQQSSISSRSGGGFSSTKSDTADEPYKTSTSYSSGPGARRGSYKSSASTDGKSRGRSPTQASSSSSGKRSAPRKESRPASPPRSSKSSSSSRYNPPPQAPRVPTPPPTSSFDFDRRVQWRADKGLTRENAHILTLIERGMERDNPDYELVPSYRGWGNPEWEADLKQAMLVLSSQDALYCVERADVGVGRRTSSWRSSSRSRPRSPPRAPSPSRRPLARAPPPQSPSPRHYVRSPSPPSRSSRPYYSTYSSSRARSTTRVPSYSSSRARSPSPSPSSSLSSIYIFTPPRRYASPPQRNHSQRSYSTFQSNYYSPPPSIHCPLPPRRSTRGNSSSTLDECERLAAAMGWYIL